MSASSRPKSTLVRERYGLGIAFLNLEAALGLDPFGKEPTL